MKENGQVIHRSMYQALTQNEWESKEYNQGCRRFMELLNQRLCPAAMVEELAELGVKDMLLYNLIENKLKNTETFLVVDEEPEVTPE